MRKQKSNEWMSISDLMSGLMLLFLFVAVSFMLQVNEDKKAVKDKIIFLKKQLEMMQNKINFLKQQLLNFKKKIISIAGSLHTYEEELNRDLHREFDKDLERWNAEITNDNTVIFKAPEVLFESGKSELKKKFEIILSDFFPRYIAILTSEKYKDEIDEVRIEGHTTNTWISARTPEEIYLNNMRLSQERAFSVLRYCYTLNHPTIVRNRKWLEIHLRANGMAFAKLKFKDKKRRIIDYRRSRRVEFRVQLKTRRKIYEILEVLK